MAIVGREAVDRALQAALTTSTGRRMAGHPGARRALARANLARRRVGQGIRLTAPAHRRTAATNPRNPTVGVAMMVQNAARLLPCALSPDLLATVNDVVVLDGGSRDDTREVARSLGARVVEQPFPSADFGLQQTRAAQASEADWVLILDADEVVSAALMGSLHELVRTRRFTGWWLGRRWLVPGAERVWWLDGLPHWPDYQARLARRTPELRYLGQVHPALAASVPGAWGVSRRTSLVHLDLLLNSRATREAKVAARRDMPDFPGSESFYLWEDHRVRIAPVPSQEAAVHRALARLGVTPSQPSADGVR